MKEFEASAEPLQEFLNATELAVQESSTRLHDLTAKKLELHKLQVLMFKISHAWTTNKPIMLKFNNTQSFHLHKLPISAQLQSCGIAALHFGCIRHANCQCFLLLFATHAF